MDENRFTALDDFSEHMASYDDEMTEQLEHNFTEQALDHFMEAFSVIAEQPQVTIDPQTITSLNELYKQYQQTDETQQVDALKSIFSTAGRALESSKIADGTFTMYVDQMKKTADNLDALVPLSEQRKQVGEVFDQAVLALEVAEESM